MITPYLTHIFNLSLSKGEFPNSLKVAKVVPIFKKGDPALPENYRPISLLPSINKLLEKIIEKRIRNFLVEKNILYEYQFGFRTGYSTSQALMEIINNIYTHLDNGQHILGVYLDLKKAFDTVDHSILLTKLHHYGIRGLSHSLMKSYLQDRKQVMHVNGSYSKYMAISTGVPQGSVLGPLLFLIYVNDIHVAAPDCLIRLFADDTNVFICDENCSNLTNKAEQAIGKLKEWFDANKLTLHLGKTTYTVFHCRYTGNDCCPQYFYVNNTKICRAPCVKYLGVLIDEKLSWQQHIQDLCNKLVKYTGIFYQIQHKIPKQIALHMYYGLIYSRLSYGIEIYGMAKTTTLKPLQIMQNKILKMLTCKENRYPTNMLYSELDLLKVSDIHRLKMHTILYRYCTGKLPNFFNRIFKPTNTNPSAPQTRNNSLFNITRPKTTYGKLLLNNYGFNLWQSLPSNIKESSSLSIFKSSVKSHLLSDYK